jgi:hypothetical protein
VAGDKIYGKGGVASMTRSCKFVLDKIIDYSKNEYPILCVQRSGYIVKCGSADGYTVIDCGKYRSEINIIIQQLVNDGFLEVPYNKGTFRLTHKGIHYKEYKFEQFKAFILNSIVVPIVVSAITALLTLWLQGLLSQP